MSEFQPVYLDAKNLDPYKRVKYSHGLVLGVDEFNQEEKYLLEKQRLHNRSLHGYGTLCGLSVSIKEDEDEDEAGRWKLIVAPGIALDAQGREIRVPEAQCADLSLWLIKYRSAILEQLGLEDLAEPPVIISPPAPISLCLVLCYRECDTDYVPVPSGPCQTLDKTSVPSRTADDFKLSLEFDCPEQIEEEKIQQLINLLKQIKISDAPGFLKPEDMRLLVKNILSDTPPDTSTLHMRQIHAADLINTALRIWVTEGRSGLVPSERNCSAGPIDDECVLLGQVDLVIEDTAAGLRILGDVTLDEQQRPFLLQTRLLQEQIISCCSEAGAISGGGGGAAIDETNLMHLTGDESVEGIKTFTDPLAFASDGRFKKRIMLQPITAMPVTVTKVTKEFFNAGVPALKFISGGEAAFNITVPNDIEYANAPRVRLLWGIKGSADITIDLNWKISNRFADPGKMFGPFSSNAIANTQTDAKPGMIYVTDTVNLSDKVNIDDVFGAIRVKLDSVNPVDAEIFLLHVEISYAANRLGRSMS